MRSRANIVAIALSATAAFVALYPALAQRAPESILPPGFGEPTPAPPPPTARDGDTGSAQSGADNGSSSSENDAIVSSLPAASVMAAGDNADALDNASVADAAAMDLPPQAVRDVDHVGLIDEQSGGFAPTAFAHSDGRFLTTLMQRLDAPIASRWASILLRRALVSRSDTPSGVEPADWVAERALLLVRQTSMANPVASPPPSGW